MATTKIKNAHTFEQAVNIEGTLTSTGVLTTTDGVTSGTARTVGGRAANAVAASSVSPAGTAETAFDVAYAIPANTLKAGSVVKIRGFGTVANKNSTDTLIIRIRFGGVDLVTSATVNVAANDIFTADCLVTIRTAGASGTFVASSSYQDPDAAGTAPKWTVTQSTAIDTTAAVTVDATYEWSVSHADNDVRLDQVYVEII